MLHKVFLCDFKSLFHTLTDSNARHYHDKLAPTICFVEFKHCLDIDVGFACTCFHFHVKRYRSEPIVGLRFRFACLFVNRHFIAFDTWREFDVVRSLNCVNVLQEVVAVQSKDGVFVGSFKIVVIFREQINLLLD
jgi:hypothetical protein